MTVENRVVDVRLSYDKGLDRYYGLLDMALALGVFEKASTRVKLPNGKTEFGKTINNNPEKYFTPDVMEQLEQVAQEYLNMEQRIEQTILKNLIQSEAFTRKVIPFLKDEYFTENRERDCISRSSIHTLTNTPNHQQSKHFS